MSLSLDPLNRRRYIALGTVAILLLAALGLYLGPGGGSIFQDGGRKPVAEWTTLFYFGADSNLGEEGIEQMITNLHFLEMVGSTEESHMLVLIDRPAADDTRLLYVEKGNSTEIPLSNANSTWVDEVNTGDPNTLYSFVEWGVKNYPAENYIVHLADHGGGWRGIVWDDTSDGDNLDLPELKEVTARIKTLIGKNIDVLSTEACLVGMIEFAYQLRESVDYYIGGETYGWGAEKHGEDEYYPGNWQYDKMWGWLAENPDASSKEVSVAMVDTFEKYGPWNYPPLIPRPNYSDVMAAFDLSRITELTVATNGLATELLSSVTGPGGLVAQRNLIIGVLGDPAAPDEFNTESFSGQMNWLGEASYTNYDLYDFAYQLSKTSAARLTRAATTEIVMNLVEEVIIAMYNAENTLEGQRAEHADAHGIAIYIPYRSSSYNPGYEETDFAKDTQWDEFLKAVAWI